MTDVKRYDCTNGGAKWCQGCYQMSEHPQGDYVAADDYAKLAAEAQALREEVERGNRITVAMALDISAVGEALGIPGEEQEGGTGEFIDLIRELQKEVAALRARVAVVPDVTGYWDGLYPAQLRAPHGGPVGFYTIPMVRTDELARLNGKVVSEGLLRRLARPADRYDEVFTLDRHEAAEELRALLGEENEHE
ncbi:hypothetical protein ACEOQO_28980 [Pseudomonas aeruginosa]